MVPKPNLPVLIIVEIALTYAMMPTHAPLILAPAVHVYTPQYVNQMKPVPMAYVVPIYVSTLSQPPVFPKYQNNVIFQSVMPPMARACMLPQR